MITLSVRHTLADHAAWRKACGCCATGAPTVWFASKV